MIPYDEWPDEFFPTNCWGVVYIMSHLVRNKLLQVFEDSDKGIFRVEENKIIRSGWQRLQKPRKEK